jgi:hypothetical protein
MVDDLGFLCDTPGGYYDASYPEPSEDSSAPAAPPSIDCFADDFGPSSGTLIDFFYEKETRHTDCTGSDCADYVMVDAACALFTRWVTSDLLMGALRDTVTCYGKDVPGQFESTSVRTSAGSAGKKTACCPLEPFVSHRACIGKFRAKYFPGK